MFDSSLTKRGAFYTPEGKVSAWIMHMEGDFNYWENKDAQVLELPYKKSNLSMVIFLPKKRNMNITLDELMKWRMNLGIAYVNLSLPKFKFTSEYNLKDALSNMGMKQVFTHDANLTGISPEKPLWAEEVYHKGYVSVDEKGTVASGITGTPLAGGIIPCVNFNANHPFFFTIQDRKTGAIFFMGWVANPIVE